MPPDTKRGLFSLFSSIGENGVFGNPDQGALGCMQEGRT